MRRHRAQANGTAAVAACLALALAAALPARAQAPSTEPAEPPAAAYADPTAPSPDFETRWLESVGAVAARQNADEETRRPHRRGSKEHPGLVILQLGDSHTAADFFTGELRKRLQALFGNGGAGYMTAGNPHKGVRSSTFRIAASAGWTYKSLFKASEPAEFWLSGYNAIATDSGQTITLETEQGVPFDAIEIETVRQPGGGAIDIKLDGRVESRYDLKADTTEPIVIRLDPATAAGDKVKQIAITTTGAGTVNIASVSVYNRRSGLSYNAVGFPGAQISLVDKFDERVFASELHRLSPHIVVLAFGTNEAYREELDPEAYAKVYERVVARIQSTLPGAVIVVVSPPDGRQHGSDKGGECGDSGWRALPQLARVREIQEDIAKRYKLVYWNWASIMPEECGAHRWASMSPPLMAKDHVHFTVEGYKKSAAEFLNTLIPIIRELRSRSNVVSNN
jgi:lysophospholipase L1-like esterase